jgi:hypothetical protein
MTRPTTRFGTAGAAAVIVTMLLALSGCASQIGGLAPVGGDALTGVRIAAVDVLLENKLGILEAPVCTQVAKSVSCVGSLTDGSVVTVEADVSTTPDTMVVTVGGTTIYDGDVQAVLDKAAQATE